LSRKIAIDFGTTNSVVAHWNDATGAAETIAVPGFSVGAADDSPTLVPSLVYVQDGQTGRSIAGQSVRFHGLDRRKDNRLFRNFKRGLVTSPAPEPRLIDGAMWTDRDAGRTFLRVLLQALPCPVTEIDELVLTAPVASFEGYLAWLDEVFGGLAVDTIRIVDESTAAALGYAVTEPGAAILVFDFGGGTLDLSLVQLPESRDRAGGFLDRLRETSRHRHSAAVVAKTGRVIGGSDIDHWLLADVIERAGLTLPDLGYDYGTLLTACERAKIALSTLEETSIEFEAAGNIHQVAVTRAGLEAVMTDNGVFVALRHVLDRTMHVAQRRGIFREDVAAVLLVGGVSLMPSVQRTLREYFGDMTVRADKPFTAVAEGALQLALGFGLEDYLAHSYGLRHLDSETGAHRYDEIIPMGSRYPTEKPIEVILCAAHDRQQEVEFVVGEIGTEDVSMVEVVYEDGQAVFVARADESAQRIVPLNLAEAARNVARLDPPGEPGEDRLKAEFRVDEERRLRVSVTDLRTHAELLHDAIVATLR